MQSFCEAKLEIHSSSLSFLYCVPFHSDALSLFQCSESHGDQLRACQFTASWLCHFPRFPVFPFQFPLQDTTLTKEKCPLKTPWRSTQLSFFPPHNIKPILLKCRDLLSKYHFTLQSESLCSSLFPLSF